MKKYFIALTTLLTLLTEAANAQVNFDNQIIVYFKSGIQRNAPSNTTATISSANILNVLAAYGIPTANVAPSFPTFAEADTVITGSPKYTGGMTGEESRQMNRAKVFTITITNTATKQNFINSLNAMTEVLYAETNGNISNNIIPVDGRFNQQWGMRNLTVPGADINLDGATNIFTGNPNSIIAIVDNGVDRLHNDLDAKIVGGDNGFAINVDGVGRQFNHGSHVAGIAAAISNNAGNNGVAGVDWQARIHPKNIFDGNGDPDITQSIIDAVNFSANVWTFNNSWSTRNQNGTPGRYSITIRSAFAQAYRNNRVSCIAMGNHQLTNPGVAGFPASINSGVLSVGATNINDGITDFSAQGTHVDVSAPGNLIWSTNFNNGYIDLSGTSMATPHVAGLASLLKGFNTNLANDDIEQIIRLTADDRGAVGFDNAFGTGRINALRALQALQAPNTLQQLNATGGTIFSTSANMTRVFLGVPGLADAAYVVKRSEVRKAITLPPMCNTVGVWGRGVGTTGYREENGRSFGEGICEVVPGTLTAAGCTLRTWIYEVWTVNGQYLGFYPRQANNVVFQYTILGVPSLASGISGQTLICSNATYSLTNLLAGSTATWSVASNPSGVLILAQNTPVLNQLRITNQGFHGVGTTLTATVTNGSCTQNITKLIANDNGGSTQIGNYNQQACTFYNVSHASQSGTLNGTPITLHQGCTTNFNLYNMFQRTVSLAPGSLQPMSWGYTAPVNYFDPGLLSVQLPLNVSGPFTFNITGNGACYSKTLTLFSYTGNGRPLPPGALMATPTNFAILQNPVESELTVTALLNGKKIRVKKDFEFSIKILDESGRLRMVRKSGKGSSEQKINTSYLSSGYYILEVIWNGEKQAIKFLKE